MKTILSFEQKQTLKELKKKLRVAIVYKPMGQGDGFNQSLVIREIRDKIKQVKEIN